MKGGLIMYEPKQIPYLLNSSYSQQIKYQEYHFKELEDYCMCLWTMKSQGTLDQPLYNYILPDACIDLIVDFSTQTVSFSGFSKETELFPLQGEINYLGVRLKPGAFYALFHIPADQIMDHMIPFHEIEPQLPINDLFEITDLQEQLQWIKSYLITKIKNKPNQQFIRIVDKLYHHPQDQYVTIIAQEFGYNQRQLFRIFKKQYGVSPKVLLNVLRLHLCLTLLLEEHQKLCDVATLCGFYDQSHFIKELKRYTGISPLQLLDHI